MSSRPEALFPLFAELTSLAGVGPKVAQNMAGLSIARPRDVIFTLPYAGIDRRLVASLKGAELPQTLTVEVLVGAHQPPRARSGAYRILVEDAESAFQLVFFHARAEYLQKQLPSGARRLVSGKVELFDGLAQMVHPDHILLPHQAEELAHYEPVYPLTAGVTQKTMTKATRAALKLAPQLPEWIDPAQKQQQGWPDWQAAVSAAHQPQTASDLRADHPARERLAYDELMAHQLTLALARARIKKAAGRSTCGTGALHQKVLAALPYTPTGAQTRTTAEITADMAAPAKMNRLLQGDVGAGKTLVAVMALLTAVEAGGQGVMMAPTEILARQHLQGLKPLGASAGVVVDLLTGRDKGRERQTKLAALAAGEIDILVGTHAVLQADVNF
ncbi:MAG: DEAD/DEAH box helicase, partial [Paracoccaceae bacterium]|nr:DEAD/DEAH box helicase [Paracoccaceae bacterium]